MTCFISKAKPTDDTDYTINSSYQAHVPITLSGKKYAVNKVYALNKQVSKYVVMQFFSNNTSILSFVLTGYGFMLPCMCFMHLPLLDHSTPDYARHSWPAVLQHDAEEPHKRQ